MEQGQPPVVAMDLDRALRTLVDALTEDGETDMVEHEIQAVDALQVLVDRARQYVAGPTSGRLAALCQVLQEPVPDRPEPVNAETVAQAYLTERQLVAITREAAAKLGMLPGW